VLTILQIKYPNFKKCYPQHYPQILWVSACDVIMTGTSDLLSKYGVSCY